LRRGCEVEGCEPSLEEGCEHCGRRSLYVSLYVPCQANAMQLSYLQSLDASVESIVATATHVALYDFSPSTSQWSRKDVEGSLFLVSTRDGRFFSVGCAIGRADGRTSGGGHCARYSSPFTLSFAFLTSPIDAYSQVDSSL